MRFVLTIFAPALTAIVIRALLGVIGIILELSRYLLSINSVCTALDFSNMYNRNNEKKKPLYLHEHMLVPLMDKKIIVPSRNTKRNISSELSNYEISLNSKFIDDGKDLSGIKILKKESFD